MATGNTIILFGDEKSTAMSDWMNDQGVFFPDTLRHGRFPSQTELRQAIHTLGFKIEEKGDWYVSSEDEFTEIWFSGDPGQGDQPVEFWCRRGEIIALDIGQSLTPLCGSLIVIHHSDGFPVLLVPDDAYLFTLPKEDSKGFFATAIYRASAQIEYLPKASTIDMLFILSQLRQTLQKASDDPRQMHELTEVMKPGLPTFSSFLTHSDTHVRWLASELLTMFREGSYGRLESFGQAISQEHDPDTKTHMINAIGDLVVPGWIGADINPEVKRILDILHQLSDAPGEAPSVQLAAVILLAKIQPGMLTLAMRTLLIDAMTHPDKYALRWKSAYSVFAQALEALDKLLINHRIEILMNALPRIDAAEDAHDATRTLLDYVFFGAVRETSRSMLSDSAPAERVAIDEKKFRSRHHPFINWLYPANPTHLTAGDLLTTQREVLQEVISLDLPWMVHSNLLEKYGLPPTRAAVRAMLQEGSS